MGDAANSRGHGPTAVTAKTPGDRAAGSPRPVPAGAPGRRQQRPERRRRRRGCWPRRRGCPPGPVARPRGPVAAGERCAEGAPLARGVGGARLRRRGRPRRAMELENRAANSLLLRARQAGAPRGPLPAAPRRPGPRSCRRPCAGDLGSPRCLRSAERRPVRGGRREPGFAVFGGRRRAPPSACGPSLPAAARAAAWSGGWAVCGAGLGPARRRTQQASARAFHRRSSPGGAALAPRVPRPGGGSLSLASRDGGRRRHSRPAAALRRLPRPLAGPRRGRHSCRGFALGTGPIPAPGPRGPRGPALRIEERFCAVRGPRDGTVPRAGVGGTVLSGQPRRVSGVVDAPWARGEAGAQLLEIVGFVSVVSTPPSRLCPKGPPRDGKPGLGSPGASALGDAAGTPSRNSGSPGERAGVGPELGRSERFPGNVFLDDASEMEAAAS